MTTRRDIVIAGGGMVGLSLALHLAYSLPRDCSISLVEGFSVPAPGASDAYHPSFDARSTALSYSSERILGNIDVWDTLSRWSCPIRSIHVSNQGRFGSTLMRATDYHWAALGHVVENAWLGNALLDVLQRRGEVELLSPVRVTAANTDRDGVRLTLEGAGPSELVTSLLVVADGAGSGLRGQLGMAVEEKPYGQQALVANIATAQAHNGCAFERFTPGGPLAMLPLVDAPGAENRSALVWTLEQGLGSELCDCDECEFLQRLQREFGYRLGRLQTVSRRDVYPLTLMQAREQVRRGIVVMGNAAHALHPVAGQGFNLALRDVAALSRTLAAGVADGKSPGDAAVLQAYADAQLDDQRRTIEFSDRLPRLFMNPDPLLGLVRDLGLSGLDVIPAAKRQFVNVAAGMSALQEPGSV